MRRPRRKIRRTPRRGALLKKIRRLRFRGLHSDDSSPMATFSGPAEFCYYEIAGQWCRCRLLPNGEYGDCVPYAGTPSGPYCGDRIL